MRKPELSCGFSSMDTHGQYNVDTIDGLSPSLEVEKNLENVTENLVSFSYAN